MKVNRSRNPQTGYPCLIHMIFGIIAKASNAEEEAALVKSKAMIGKCALCMLISIPVMMLIVILN